MRWGKSRENLLKFVTICKIPSAGICLLEISCNGPVFCHRIEQGKASVKNYLTIIDRILIGAKNNNIN